MAFIFGQLYRSFYSPPHLPFFFVAVFTGFILLLAFYLFFFFSLDKQFDTFNWYLLVSVDGIDLIPKKKEILNEGFELFLCSSLRKKQNTKNKKQNKTKTSTLKSNSISKQWTKSPSAGRAPANYLSIYHFFFYHFHTFAILHYQLNHSILFSRVLWIFIQNGEVTSAEQS